MKKCVNDQKSAAKGSHPSFFEYLDSAPKLEDPTDSKQCGKTREYFGFEETFVNDLQICEDIEQLKFERDFTFLDDFFNQGAALSDGDDAAPPAVPALELTEPDHCKIVSLFLSGYA